MTDSKTDTPKRENVGKLSYDLLTKVQDSVNPIDQMRENLKDFEKNMYECYNRGKKEFDSEFYVVVITKKERLMPNVLRNYFASRRSCPTPDYDQAVYRYDKSEDSLKFLWVIPSRDTCQYMIAHALEISGDEHTLLKFVMDFTSGSLLKHAKKLNGEKADSPLLEK